MLGYLLCVVAAVIQPYDLWVKIIVTAILAPIVVEAGSRFFGVYQLIPWDCGKSRDRRDKGS